MSFTVVCHRQECLYFFCRLNSTSDIDLLRLSLQIFISGMRSRLEVKGKTANAWNISTDHSRQSGNDYVSNRLKIPTKGKHGICSSTTKIPGSVNSI